MKINFVHLQRWFFYLALILIGLAGCNALLRSTPYGLGLINDSASYVDGANNLLKGLGYVRTSGDSGFKPITNYPPVFSILLVPLRLFGLDIFQSGRYLITFLFGVDILFVGLLIYRISRSFVFALIGALLLAYSDSFLEVYAYLLSEPLFITFMLLAFYLLSIYFEKRRGRWLFYSGVVLGIASLTRYVGLSVVISFALALLFLEPNWRYILTVQENGSFERISLSWRRFSSNEASLPIKEIAILLASSLPLILLWMVYTFFVNGGLGNRSLIWHPINPSDLYEAMKHNFDWLAPRRLVLTHPDTNVIFHAFSLLLIPGLVFGILGEIWWRFKSKREQSLRMVESETAFVLALHILVYILFLVISISLFDASTPLNYRIMSVAIIPLIVLFVGALAWIWQAGARSKNAAGWAARLATGLFCIVLVYSGVKDGTIAINNLSQDGLGFAQRSLTSSEAIQLIRQMPPITIFTNKPPIILLLTGKASMITPTSIDPVKAQARDDFLNQIETIHTEVRNGQAVLVLFDLKDKSDPTKYSLFQALSDGLFLQDDYGNIQIFAQEK
jgi:hypothetical protein